MWSVSMGCSAVNQKRDEAAESPSMSRERGDLRVGSL